MRRAFKENTFQWRRRKRSRMTEKNEKISFDSVRFVKFCLVGCSVVVGYAFSMFVLTLASHSSSFGSLVPPLPLPTPPPPLFLRLVQIRCLFPSFYRFFFIRVAFHFRTLVFRRPLYCILFAFPFMVRERN